MKETWNLNKTVSSAIFQAAYFEDITSKDAEGIADRLCIEIEANYRTHKLDTWKKLAEEVLGDSRSLTIEERQSINEFVMSQFDKSVEANQAILGNELFKAKEEIAKLKERLEAAQKVVEAAKKSIASDITDDDTDEDIILIDTIEAYDAQMKEDSLRGENIK